MKMVAVILLSAYLFAGSLLPGNDYSELSAVPKLMEHFQYHKTHESPGIGFIEFMAMHYSDSNHEKSDPKNHSGLPVHHGFTSIINDRIVSAVIIIEAPTVPLSDSIKPQRDYTLFIPVNFTDSIFHPPKV